MIELSNGHKFSFQCASGALGFDGLGYFWEYPLRWLGLIDPTQFTVVAKTVTLNPREGNLSMWHPWTCVRLLPEGTVNSVGLTNPGLETWIETYYPRAQKKGYDLAASVESDSWEDAFVIGTFLADCDLKFIEVNVSCPNVGKMTPADMVTKVIKGLKESCPKHPVILKMSFQQTQDEQLVTKLGQLDEIEAVHVINSVPWEVIFPDQPSPLEKYNLTGGVSGTYIHSLARTAVRNIKRLIPNKPVVAGGGIYSLQEISNFKYDGASAYSFGTLFLRKPWMPNQIIKQIKNYEAWL
jgi:dihydroorotate dehydrogenase (NAD+) catalytic subunit